MESLCAALFYSHISSFLCFFSTAQSMSTSSSLQLVFCDSHEESIRLIESGEAVLAETQKMAEVHLEREGVQREEGEIELLEEAGGSELEVTNRRLQLIERELKEARRKRLSVVIRKPKKRESMKTPSATVSLDPPAPIPKESSFRIAMRELRAPRSSHPDWQLPEPSSNGPQRSSNGPPQRGSKPKRMGRSETHSARVSTGPLALERNSKGKDDGRLTERSESAPIAANAIGNSTFVNVLPSALQFGQDTRDLPTAEDSSIPSSSPPFRFLDRSRSHDDSSQFEVHRVEAADVPFSLGTAAPPSVVSPLPVSQSANAAGKGSWGFNRPDLFQGVS